MRAPLHYFVRMRRGLVLTVVSVSFALAACGSTSGAGSGSTPGSTSGAAPASAVGGASASGSAAGGASASGSGSAAAVSRRPGVLVLSSTDVGPLDIGADRATTEAKLRALLGPPDRTLDGPGCELISPVPHDVALFWGDFHVLLSAPVASDPDVRLAGWSLTGPATPVAMVLPHNVTLGSSTGKDVLAADQGATTEPALDPAASMVVDSDEVSFGLAGTDPSGRITDVTFGIAPCD